MRDTPLVTCIMPTRNRPGWVERAVLYFEEQDYPRKELIILDDSPAATVPRFSHAHVRYVHEDGNGTLGEKRNRAIELSRGQIIVHWDDDDWMARRRIRYQVEALLAGGASVCGLDRMLFFDLRTRRMWLYQYPAGARKWLAGGSLCYWKKVWEAHPFDPVTPGEDTRFVWSLEVPMGTLADFTFYVATIHGRNTCPKQLIGTCWSRWQGPGFESLVGADRNFYAKAPQGG